MNEPRVWKWMVPAFVMVGLVPVALLINDMAQENGWAWFAWCNFPVVGWMFFLGIQAWAAFKAYYRALEVQDFVDRRNALATTPEVKMFEYARSMHPEAVRSLLLQKKIIWRVKAARPGDMADWVLDEDPSIRVRFVEYILENSTKVKLMPQNLLSEGAFTFDPQRLVSDREMYQALHRVLINHQMATDAFGNQPGQWIPPWEPELVAGRWGIVMDNDVPEVPEVAETVKTPPPTPNKSDPLPTSPILGERHAKRGGGEIATDDEMAKINALETARANMSVKDYMAFCKSQ